MTSLSSTPSAPPWVETSRWLSPPLSRSSGTSTDSTMRPIRPGRQRRRVPFPAIPNPSVGSARQIATPAVEDGSEFPLYGSAFLPKEGSPSQEPPTNGHGAQSIPPASIEIGTDLALPPDALAASASELAELARTARLAKT